MQMVTQLIIQQLVAQLITQNMYMIKTQEQLLIPVIVAVSELCPWTKLKRKRF